MMTEKFEVIEKEEETLYYFKELSPGDIFKDRKGDYYMRLGDMCSPSGKDWFNAIKLMTGSFTFLHDESKVYPFKKVEILVYK